MKPIVDVQAAVALAADRAIAAKAQGTFGVGGVLLDSHGTVLKALHNNVLRHGLTFDPTAHGERQLVDWYFAERARGAALPPPCEITVVASVDPCCMCTGALLVAGFNLVAAAADAQAGINYDASASFSSLPQALRGQAKSGFCYPAVDGDLPHARPAAGAALPGLFAGRSIDQATQALCAQVFAATIQDAARLVHTDLPAEQLRNPASLAHDHPIVVGLKKRYRHALAYRCTPHLPDAGLAPFLVAAMAVDRQRGGSGEAVALLDGFGNLLLCAAGNFAQSAVRTPFMECTRQYAQLRYDLLSSAEGAAQQAVRRYLAHPKEGTFVFTSAPDMSASSFMDLGAYGSTMEGPLLAHNLAQWQYVRSSVTQPALDALCAGLPPLYRDVLRPRPVRVADGALVAALAASQA